MIALMAFCTCWVGKTSRRKKLPPQCVGQQQKKTRPNICNTSSKKCLKQWGTYPIVASSKVANVLHNTNQPSISTISRIFATWLVSPSFAYSVWPDTVKGKSTMLRDWQNPLHVNMWEQGVKFLMPLILRIFLKLCLLRNQILHFS